MNTSEKKNHLLTLMKTIKGKAFAIGITGVNLHTRLDYSPYFLSRVRKSIHIHVVSKRRVEQCIIVPQIFQGLAVPKCSYFANK